MRLNAARLLPHEIERRRLAYARAFGNPSERTDNSGMAGVSSIPVSAKGPSDVNLPPAVTPAGFSAGVVCVVTYDEAREWATRHGLYRFRKALDLIAVNAFRRRMRLPPFALKWEC